MAEPTGDQLLQYLHRDRHHHQTLCPGCQESVSRCGIVDLAYAFDICSCDEADYDHLVERVWHLRCLTAAAPDRSAMEMLDTAQFVLERYKRGQETARQIRDFLASRTPVPSGEGDDRVE